jgi:biopolymer transport protein ExbD
MVVTVMKEDNTAAKIDLPYTQYADYVKGQDQIIQLAMDIEDGKTFYYIDNKKYKNLKSVENHLIKLKTEHIANPDLSIKIKIDKNTPMKYVNEIKSLLQNNSFFKVKYLIRNMDM